jgi:hypothetical protein
MKYTTPDLRPDSKHEAIKDILYNFLQDYTSTKNSAMRDMHIEFACHELEKLI